MSEFSVPVLISNFKPFRLIPRDESDIWNPDLEQINSATYDYVKLHRASKFFNAHLPRPMPACFGFDGSLIFPFIEEFKDENFVVEEVNRVLASIFLGGVYVESITPSDVSFGMMNLIGYYRHAATRSSNADFHRAIGECDAGNIAAIKLLEPEMIYAEKLISAYEYGNKVLSMLPTLSPSLMINAFTYYKQHQLREAMANAWISVEQMLELIWDKTIVQDAKSINIPKRRQFLESQQWNSAHKIEVLYQNSFINESLYAFLSEARNSRNGFIHKGLAPSYKECESALMSLILLIEVSSGINEIEFNKSNLEGNLLESSKPYSQPIYANFQKKGDVSNAKYWRGLKVLPGSDGWEGDYESFPDITLSPLDEHK